MNVRATFCHLLMPLLSFACVDPRPQDAAGTPDASVWDGDAGALPDAGGTPDASSTCSTPTLPLRVRIYDDGERYYVPVERAGEAALLMLDTGSSLSFVFTGAGQPDYQANHTQLRVGCLEVWVAGRGFDPFEADLNGVPIIGLMGMDWLLSAPSLLDVEGRTLQRLEALPADLIADPAARAVPFDNVQGHALVPCSIDEQPVRLMFDTGAGNTMWVGVNGQAGDRELQVQDAVGNIFSVFAGTGQLACGAHGPITAPVKRAPEFPYFEETAQILGGNLHGLLGVTAFAGRRFLFDGSQSTFWVLPRP
jgi:hypothetical protein